MSDKKSRYIFTNDGMYLMVKENIPMWDGSYAPGAVASVRIENDSHCCGIMRIGNFSHKTLTTEEQREELLDTMTRGLASLVKAAPTAHRKGYMFASLHSHGKQALTEKSLEDAQKIMTYPLWSKALLACGFTRLTGFINPNSGNYVETYGLGCVSETSKKDYINVS